MNTYWKRAIPVTALCFVAQSCVVRSRAATLRPTAAMSIELGGIPAALVSGVDWNALPGLERSNVTIRLDRSLHVVQGITPTVHGAPVVLQMEPGLVEVAASRQIDLMLEDETTRRSMADSDTLSITFALVERDNAALGMLGENDRLVAIIAVHRCCWELPLLLVRLHFDGERWRIDRTGAFGNR